VAAVLFGIGLAIAWTAHLPWLVTNPLLFGVAPAYLAATSARARRGVSWAFVPLLAAFGVGTLGYIGELYGGGRSATVLPWRFPGGVVFEEVEWTALFFAGILVVNERFFATPFTPPVRQWAKVALIAQFYLTFLVFSVPALNAPFRDHVYIKACPPVQLPVIAMALLVNRAVWREMLCTAAVVTACMLPFEVLALHKGYWVFGGQYIGLVPLAGYRIPVEELLFMVLGSGPAVVGAHAVWKNWRLPGWAGPRADPAAART
jgi:hypothetical protein